MSKLDTDKNIVVVGRCPFLICSPGPSSSLTSSRAYRMPHTVCCIPRGSGGGLFKSWTLSPEKTWKILLFSRKLTQHGAWSFYLTFPQFLGTVYRRIKSRVITRNMNLQMRTFKGKISSLNFKAASMLVTALRSWWLNSNIGDRFFTFWQSLWWQKITNLLILSPKF